jgi:HlyD family secretion protein
MKYSKFNHMQRRKKNYNLVIGILALLLIVLFLAIIGYLVSYSKPPITQGEAEATEYRISGKVTGRIDEIYIREGDKVKKGDTLAHYDSPEVRAKMAQAEGATAAAGAMSRKAQNGSRAEEITKAYQVWQQALVQEEVMRKSYERIEKLREQEVVSAQKYDEVKAKYDASVAQRKAAKSQYDMAVNGARAEDKAAAEAQLRQGEGAVAEVQSYADELYLISPVDGVVTKVYVHEGELVGQGAPVATVTDPYDIWFTFNIREDNLREIRNGKTIQVMIPALNNKKVKATVYYIAAQDEYATYRAVKETGGYDAKTFEVRATPDEGVGEYRNGMSVIMLRDKPNNR